MTRGALAIKGLIQEIDGLWLPPPAQAGSCRLLLIVRWLEVGSLDPESYCAQFLDLLSPGESVSSLLAP